MNKGLSLNLKGQVYSIKNSEYTELHNSIVENFFNY